MPTADQHAPNGDRPRLYVGCAMWSHRPWVGRWIPRGTTADAAIRAYGRFCNAVEGNTTFYAVPSEATVARWSDQASSDFRFLFKMPRSITHEARLHAAQGLVTEFLTRMEPLQDRCGPTCVQLPASFGPRDFDVLRAFLGGLSRQWRWSVELRHPDFFDDDIHRRAVDHLLHHHSIDKVVLDSRALFAGPCSTAHELEAFKNKPRLTVRPTATAHHPVVRLIGQTDPLANPAYWSKWVDKVVGWLNEGRTPAVFVHTADNAAAPELVQWFIGEVARHSPPDAVLPPARGPLPHESHVAADELALGYPDSVGPVTRSPM